MERNPYAPPKANVSDHDVAGSSVVRELYTPSQHAVAAFIGSPIAAAVLAAFNYRALGRSRDANQVVVWGIVATFVVFGVALVLPDEFPNAVLPLAYTVAIRSLAQMQFGAVVDAHRAGGGRIGSWWRVVGIGFLSLIVIGGVFFAIVLALVYAGVLE